MNRRYISLSLAGDLYDYVYDMEKKEVYTEDFPDIPIEKVRLVCGHTLTHDEIRTLIENRIKAYELLNSSFS